MKYKVVVYLTGKKEPFVYMCSSENNANQTAASFLKYPSYYRVSIEAVPDYSRNYYED